jgi:hypothetical protein
VLLFAMMVLTASVALIFGDEASAQDRNPCSDGIPLVSGGLAPGWPSTTVTVTNKLRGDQTVSVELAVGKGGRKLYRDSKENVSVPGGGSKSVSFNVSYDLAGKCEDNSEPCNFIAVIRDVCGNEIPLQEEKP